MDCANCDPSYDQPRPQAWTIPVCFQGATCQLLTPQTEDLQKKTGEAIIYANAGDKGYYRTEYVPEQLKTIVAHAEAALTPPERIGLLGDEWALMRAGQGPVGDFWTWCWP